MRKRLGRSLGTAALAAASVAVFAAPAKADLLIDPPIAQFGSLPIGTTSAPQQIKLTVTCNLEMSCAPDPYRFDFVVQGDYALVETDCPESPMIVPGLTMEGESCHVTVTFTPRVVGNRGGLILTGDYHARPDPPIPFSPGPPAQMAGFGLIPGSGNQAIPGAATGTTPYGTTPAKKKKCKRKRGKAKKRCKRKRRKR